MLGLRRSVFAAAFVTYACLVGGSWGIAGCARQPLSRGPAAPVEPARKTLNVTGAGTALERLTSEPVSEQVPAISPDGSTLLFGVSVFEKGKTEPKIQTLVAVNPNTRAQRTLYTAETSRASDPAWYPDGTSYVYSSDSPGNRSLVRALTAAPNAAISVIASGEVAPGAAAPTLSPDGKRVAFNMLVRDTLNVAVIDANGSHLTILGEGFHPTWSPDGSAVAFVRKVGEYSQIVLVDPTTGTDLVQLTSGEFDHRTPAWSPDGQYIEFFHDARVAQGGAREQANESLHRQARRNRSHPADGRRLLFDHTELGRGQLDLFRFGPGGELRHLASEADGQVCRTR